MRTCLTFVPRRLLARCESVKGNIRDALLKPTGATGSLPIIDEAAFNVVATADSESTTDESSQIVKASSDKTAVVKVIPFVRSIQEMRERTSESASSIFELNELPMITFQRFIYSRQISSERTTKFLEHRKIK